MESKYKKITIYILILIGFLASINIYLNSKKESINIDKSFNNAIAIEDNKISKKINIDIDAKLSDTHFMYRYLKYSKELKGTVNLNGEKYNISASSSVKDETLKGVLTKDENSLVSDFEVVLNEDFNQICIYKGDYIIAAPANTLDEANLIYKNMVDIPIN